MNTRELAELKEKMKELEERLVKLEERKKPGPKPNQASGTGTRSELREIIYSMGPDC